jgi:hypothetical protein
MPLQDIDTELKKSEFELLAFFLKECLPPYQGDIAAEMRKQIRLFDDGKALFIIMPSGKTLVINPDGTWEVES